MKNLLLLDNRFSPDGSDMWRVCVRRGWKTDRPTQYNVKSICSREYDLIRYYGNTLHAAQIESGLPFKFVPIDYSILSKVPEHTKRNISYIRYETLGQPIVERKFIKPAREKWFEAKVYDVGEFISGSPNGDDYIYVSDVVKFVDEVRCFVLNGEVLTSSLYRIGSVVWDATNERPEDINFDSRISSTPIPSMVADICSKHKLPAGVVIDFGLTPTGEWMLIEFNEAWASGMYYCDYNKCLDVVIASQENNS